MRTVAPESVFRYRITGDALDMVKIAQIFFHMPGSLFAPESRVAFLSSDVLGKFRPRNSGLHVGIAGDLFARPEDCACSRY
jgi:hypothetical protein